MTEVSDDCFILNVSVTTSNKIITAAKLRTYRGRNVCWPDGQNEDDSCQDPGCIAPDCHISDR